MNGVTEDPVARAKAAVRKHDKTLRERNDAIRAAVAASNIATVVRVTGMSRAQVERIAKGATKV